MGSYRTRHKKNSRDVGGGGGKKFGVLVRKRRVGSYRKKGAILIEFLAAIPVFFLILWGIMNLMVYLLSVSQLNEAAYESARTVAVEMRGVEGQIDSSKHVGAIPAQISKVTSGAKFIRINTPGYEAVYAYSKSDCQNVKADNAKNFLCAYVESYLSNGKEMEQVVVLMRSEFDVIGEFVPGLEKLVKLSAKAVVQKELPGRYNYAQ